jgi:DNA-binding NarL/FixJ family response regulator
MKKVHVFIADDHEVVINGLKSSLDDSCDNNGNQSISVIGCARTAVELLHNASRQDVDVFVIDLGFESTVGDTSIISMMLEKNPNARIIVFTARTSNSTLMDCYSSGAKGCVKKTGHFPNLFDAIFTVAEGNDYFEPGTLEKFGLMNIRNPLRGLDTREKTIFLELAKNPDIEKLAKRLDVSEKTIINIITNRIKPVLGVGRKDFRKLAIKLGLVEE